MDFRFTGADARAAAGTRQRPPGRRIRSPRRGETGRNVLDVRSIWYTILNFPGRSPHPPARRARLLPDRPSPSRRGAGAGRVTCRRTSEELLVRFRGLPGTALAARCSSSSSPPRPSPPRLRGSSYDARRTWQGDGTTFKYVAPGRWVEVNRTGRIVYRENDRKSDYVELYDPAQAVPAAVRVRHVRLRGGAGALQARPARRLGQPRPQAARLHAQLQRPAPPPQRRPEEVVPAPGRQLRGDGAGDGGVQLHLLESGAEQLVGLAARPRPAGDAVGLRRAVLGPRLPARRGADVASSRGWTRWCCSR